MVLPESSRSSPSSRTFGKPSACAFGQSRATGSSASSDVSAGVDSKVFMRSMASAVPSAAGLSAAMMATKSAGSGSTSAAVPTGRRHSTPCSSSCSRMALAWRSSAASSTSGAELVSSRPHGTDGESGAHCSSAADEGAATMRCPGCCRCAATLASLRFVDGAAVSMSSAKASLLSF